MLKVHITITLNSKGIFRLFAEFEKARGYKIERENYIADLLGKKPPPPDVGKETNIKPLGKKRPYTYNAIEEVVHRKEKIRISNDSFCKVRDRKPKKRSKYESKSGRESTHKSPLVYEQEVDGHTMRYGKRRPDGTKNRHKRRRSSSSEFDYRYDY